MKSHLLKRAGISSPLLSDETVVHVHSGAPPAGALDDEHVCGLAQKNVDNAEGNWRMGIALLLCLVFMAAEITGKGLSLSDPSVREHVRE